MCCINSPLVPAAQQENAHYIHTYMCGGAHLDMKCIYMQRQTRSCCSAGAFMRTSFLLYVCTVLYRFHIRIHMFCTAVDKSVICCDTVLLCDFVSKSCNFCTVPHTFSRKAVCRGAVLYCLRMKQRRQGHLLLLRSTLVTRRCPRRGRMAPWNLCRASPTRKLLQRGS